jgi:putative ABC transport system permease protein
LHNQIEPMVLIYRPEWAQNMFIKIRAGKTASATEFVRAAIEKIMPGALFNYGFLDDKIAGLYSKEDNMSKILKVFAALSIMISCLGLFGLAAHASEIRTKEIGIRKVIGASLPNLIRLLSKEFLLLVLIGNLAAWPLAWWAMHKWLEEFMYKVQIGWTVFFVSAILTIAIAILTISYHCFRTANMNPIKSLRTE